MIVTKDAFGVSILDKILDVAKSKVSGSAIVGAIGNPASAITYMEVRTTVSPMIRVEYPFGRPASGSAPAGPPGTAVPGSAQDKPTPLMKLLKPSITFSVLGGKPTTVAPYGDPGGSWWPALAVLGVFGVAGLSFFLIRGVSTLAHKR